MGIQGWADAGTPRILRERASGGRPQKTLARESSEVSTGAKKTADPDETLEEKAESTLKAEPKKKGKAKAKGKAKDGNKLKVSDVEKELKKTLPLVDKKIAVDSVVSKFGKIADNDKKFKAWAEADLTEVVSMLEDMPVAMDTMMEKIMQFRSSDGNIGKGVLAMYGEDSERQLIGLGDCIIRILDEVDPIVDKICRMRSEEVRAQSKRGAEKSDETPAKKRKKNV